MKARTSNPFSRRCLWIVGLLSLVESDRVLAQSSSQSGTDSNSNLAVDDTTPEDVRKILLGLYTETGGLDWDDSSNWFQQGVNICDWKGITCYVNATTTDDSRRQGHVKAIDLSGDGLVGTAPSTIFDLPYLETLILENNPDLDVDFSGITNAQFLEELSVSKTKVSNIDAIGNATSLKLLHITDLKLQGTIPSALMNLQNLEALYANYNSFSGRIPTEIALLANLQELYLQDSMLTGQLPSDIGRLTLLQILTLTDNALSGSLPTQMNDMTNLQILSIQRTGNEGDWKGPGISGPIPSFSLNLGLKEIHMENQRFSGSLPSDFLLAAPAGETVTVDLTNNALTGAVPSTLVDKRFLNLYLAGNQINSIPANIYDTSAGTCSGIGDWMSGDVSSLGCNAFLCPPGTWAPEGRMTTTDSCASCADTTRHWGLTECQSSTTPDVREREILLNFYNVMGGRDWKVDDGWLALDRDPCQWHGIACDSTTGFISSIILRNNGLSGVIPSDLFDLPGLQILNLESNDIQFDFVAASKATKLQSIDLSSTGLTSLSGIDGLSSLSNLGYFSIASNNLGGSIPSAVFTLSSLEELVLSDNEFSGVLSSSIGDLTNLKRFACEGNKLTGPLPATIGNLVLLEEFAAAENDFSGSLPSALNSLVNLQTLTLQQVTGAGAGIGGPLLSFRDLTQLRTLKLDSNQLTGSLPSDFLVNSRHLQHTIDVGLSDNMFEGAIPSEWSRFDQLIIDLAGNKISSIPSVLCSENGWMGGAVAKFQCDAILCPGGTYNNLGHQADDASSCISCPESTLMGATFCGDQGTTDESSEINILLDLFSETGGTGWLVTDGWDNSTDMCNNWYGVECDGAGRVTILNLTNNNLRGTVPSSIFKLQFLRELVLSGNPVDFSFEGIGQAAKLVNLYLDNTNVISLDGIGDAVGLQIVNIADNNFEGEIPFDLYLLTNLKTLDIGYNFFAGRLNTAFGSMSSLESLQLYHNQFTGPIPAEFGVLTNLQELNLAENNFDGTIPAELNDLTNLRFLSIQREGGILGTSDVGISHGASSQLGLGLTGPLPAFDKLTSITELYLGVNGLTGSIPFNFLDGVQDKGSLIKVDLTANMLTGTIPASLTQFDTLSLFAAGNRITAIADGLCAKTQWLNGDVGTFACTGILCPAGTYNAIGREGNSTTSCQACSSGTSGYLGSFQCLSSEDAQAGSERATLEFLYNAMDGPNWVDSTNWLDPDVSICDWFGIQCVSDTVKSVASIVLQKNRLKNVFPSEIYQLPNLMELNLQGNDITFSFNGIGNAASLESLDLEDTGLTSLLGISQAAGLKLLRVDGNNFAAFPDDVFGLTTLEVLSLSNNDFPAAVVPDSLQSLTSLTYFGCSVCGFFGPIPTFFGSMLSLQYLTLSQNALTGTLPSTFESISTLKHLDLSEQASLGRGISGNLLSFSTQTQLTELYLQHNNLQGPIPSTFLSSVRKDELVTIDLRYNALNSTLPVELGNIDKLNLYVSSNLFTSIPQSLCAENWNDGDVVKNGCDGIMCGQGTFNALGRATADLECFPCNDPLNSQYLGNTFCGSALEHQALIYLYRSFGGPNWKSDNNWLMADDHCTWEGITCWVGGEFDGLVQKIELADNNLIGAMPFGLIWQLEGLTLVDLSSNDISLPFSSIANAVNLEAIILSETQTSSLEFIGEAKNLKSLHLTGAAFSGPIPDELFALTLLEELYMSHNNFTGTLPSTFGQLNLLKDLYLFSNKLEGTIPTELGFLAKLEHLSLGNNNFVGSVPRQITSLPLLEFLSLENESGGPNSLTPGGLSGPVPALDGFPRIRELYMGHNSFTGTLPDHFLQGVYDKNAQITIDLSFNKIEGSIPAALSNFRALSLLLAGNEISEVPADLCKKFDWMNAEVANGCDAILCPPGTFNLEGRRVDSKTLCEACTYPGSARLYGSTSCVPGAANTMDDRSILAAFYDASGGTSWTTSTGWKSDNVPICEWFGVTCTTSDAGEQHVSEINLIGNNLNGIVPSVVFHLPALRKIDIRGNPVSMTFLGIQDSELEELYLDETLVNSLDGIGNAKKLRVLNVHKNSFRRNPIPEELFNVKTLTALNLSDSSIGGTLSTKVGQLTSLQRLTLSGNALSGELPSEFGQLKSLQELEVSNNNWIGTLPSSWSGMAALQALFIDNSEGETSGISGPLIPFATMPNLRELNLAENQLTGTIPTTFLSGVAPTTSIINVRLNNNQLVGTVPSSLTTFSKLNIDVTGNLFTAIGSGLCGQSQWNNGNVGSYSCDAIMCPAGEYSPSGRQTSAQDACAPCPGAEDSPYLGVDFCLSLAKKREREILGLLFQATNGNGWGVRDGWMDENKDICTWYGIACQQGSTVESIDLASNQLSGSIPKEIYELQNLKSLWLYSNPIEISFEGIEQATNLQSLILSSTKLRSLSGIGAGGSLVDVDVRFNQLSGPIPKEIESLTKLESFTASVNSFTGTVPELSTLTKLTTLRLSDNKLTGPLPSFYRQPDLNTLELSKNQLNGAVPSNFFESVSSGHSLVLDLSENMLTGTVPGTLARFSDVTIYMRDNRINGIDPSLCSKDNWNKGDVRKFNCDGILCPAGTYAVSGRASAAGSTCEECGKNQYLGGTACGSSAASLSRWGAAVVPVLVLGAITTAVLVL